MKKIKYLQDYVCGSKGDIKVVYDITADNLVAMGVAEYVDDDDDEKNEQLNEIDTKESQKHKKR